MLIPSNIKFKSKFKGTNLKFDVVKIYIISSNVMLFENRENTKAII